MVIWIIGMSGSGKSFLAKKLHKRIDNSILVDGDEIRKKFTYDLGYSKKDREKNSKFIQNLCKFLEDQNVTVICSILSIFPSHQKKNRKIFKKYFQIFINSNLDKLKFKSKNRVYKLKRNVVGLDINFPKPYKNDLVIENNYNKKISIPIKKILQKIK